MPLQNILRRSSDLVATFDLELKVVHWNDSMEEHTGISRKKTVGKPLFDVLPDLEAPLGDLIKEQVLQDGTDVEYLHDLQIHLKNDIILHTSAGVFPYHEKESGKKILGGILMLYPFKKAPKYSPKLSKLLLSIPYYSNEAIIITEAVSIDQPNGPIIVYVNRAFTAITGYQEAEVLGKTPRILQGPGTDRSTLNRIRAALEKRQPVQAELLNYRKDGTPYWFGINIVPVINEVGWTTHFIGVQREITNQIRIRKKLEKTVAARTKRLEQAVEDLEAFAYSASHDLKQPLRTITTHLGLVKRKAEGNISEELIILIDEAIEGAHRMYQLLEGLLQYSRISAQDEDFELIDISELIRQKISDLKKAYPDREIEVEIQSDSIHLLEGHPVHLEQVFQNLLSNAVKYSEGPTVKISIQVKTTQNEHRITVTDNGHGIPGEERSNLFRLFSRNHTKIEGTGIGLAICQRIIHRHGGEIGIAPYREGEGATFWFTLPKAEEVASAPGQVE